MSAGTFAAFSKFFLNTSKSPNGKVVQFVKAHNFHVEWHCWIEVQIDEKCKSMSALTVHQGRDFCQVSLQFMSNPLIQTPRAFVKLVEGSVVSKFGSQTLEQFCLENSRKFNSK
jgi:hypothetical protein